MLIRLSVELALRVCQLFTSNNSFARISNVQFDLARHAKNNNNYLRRTP